MLDVARGKDPQAERMAKRSQGTFAELADRYVNEYAKKKNRSWKQADYLIRKHVLGPFGKLQAANITRDDMKALMGRIEARVVANQTIAATSAIFSWAMREGVGGIQINPCAKVELNDTASRERVLSDSELPLFWAAFNRAGMAGAVLKTILLTGQRRGEVVHMRTEHIDGNFWTMPGSPDRKLGWPGTKNGDTHMVWLPKPVQELLIELNSDGFVFAGPRGGPVWQVNSVMRDICAELRINNKVTPHDLRRTHGTCIAKLGFGRDAMNRIQNHRDGGIASVYDRHEYAAENQMIMERVAAHILSIAEGKDDSANVVPLRAG